MGFSGRECCKFHFYSSNKKSSVLALLFCFLEKPEITLRTVHKLAGSANNYFTTRIITVFHVDYSVSVCKL